jgi:hypothetical protein
VLWLSFFLAPLMWWVGLVLFRPAAVRGHNKPFRALQFTIFGYWVTFISLLPGIVGLSWLDVLGLALLIAYSTVFGHSVHAKADTQSTRFRTRRERGDAG